ncbi:DUF4238 domain-containing protein [Olivibacter sp. SDN3]|uniref:DUF4238 domain-containing protein n=1 Tax=Olivibacter sp. SDN3 TaxID=2764720 RepID=UPI0016510E94|nr:DUF4238 domain-containing protein [Olivibacter sp. SDN3]QNL49650.1 DUF4238 domain-containing protein [Olivibacter sp. SDN3]
MEQIIQDILRRAKLANGSHTKNNHYIPCFWSSCWNAEVLHKHRSNILPKKGESRKAKVSAFKIGEKIFREKDKVESCFYLKDIYNVHYYDERRIAKSDFDTKALAQKGIAFILDIENLFTEIEGLYISDLLTTIKTGEIRNLTSKTMLSFFIHIQLMRTPMVWQKLIDDYDKENTHKNPFVEMQNKIRLFSDVRQGLESKDRLFNAAYQYLKYNWKVYKLREYKFPLADNFLTVAGQRLFIALAPDILLEIDTTRVLLHDDEKICEYYSGIDHDTYLHFIQGIFSQAKFEIIHIDLEQLKALIQLYSP